MLKSTELIKHLKNLIHQETQQRDNCVDLTLSSVHEFTDPGSLDFGGSEFKAAETKEIVPMKRNEEDDYGWWSLEHGTYRAICNESFEDFGDQMALIVPNNHARQAGIMVNSIVADTAQNSAPISLLIHIPASGCNIKENARFASVYMISEQKGLGQAIP